MIHVISGLNYDSNIYLVTGKVPTIVDCGTGLWNDYVMKQLESIIDCKKIKQIALTHEHFDHCGGVRKIYDKSSDKTKILAHVDASKKIENGESAFAKMLGGVMPKMPVDVKLSDGDKVIFGDDEYEVIHTPGHSPGSLCFYSKVNGTIFSGDTVFSNGAFGRYDLPGGNPDLLRDSIERLSKLEIFNLYPGHMAVAVGDGQKHMELVLKNTEYLL